MQNCTLRTFVSRSSQQKKMKICEKNMILRSAGRIQLDPADPAGSPSPEIANSVLEMSHTHFYFSLSRPIITTHAHNFTNRDFTNLISQNLLRCYRPNSSHYQSKKSARISQCSNTFLQMCQL